MIQFSWKYKSIEILKLCVHLSALCPLSAVCAPSELTIKFSPLSRTPPTSLSTSSSSSSHRLRQQHHHRHKLAGKHNEARTQAVELFPLFTSQAEFFALQTLFHCHDGCAASWCVIAIPTCLSWMGLSFGLPFVPCCLLKWRMCGCCFCQDLLVLLFLSIGHAARACVSQRRCLPHSKAVTTPNYTAWVHVRALRIVLFL